MGEIHRASNLLGAVPEQALLEQTWLYIWIAVIIIPWIPLVLTASRGLAARYLTRILIFYVVIVQVITHYLPVWTNNHEDNSFRYVIAFCISCLTLYGWQNQVWRREIDTLLAEINSVIPFKKESINQKQLIIEGASIKVLLTLVSLTLAAIILIIDAGLVFGFSDFDNISVVVTIPFTLMVAGSIPFYLEVGKRINSVDQKNEEQLQGLRNALIEIDRNIEPIWQFYKTRVAFEKAPIFQQWLYESELQTPLSKKELNPRDILKIEIGLVIKTLTHRAKFSQRAFINQNGGDSTGIVVSDQDIDTLSYLLSADELTKKLRAMSDFGDEDPFPEANEKEFKELLQRSDARGFNVEDRHLIGRRLGTWLDNETLCRVEATNDRATYPHQKSLRLQLASDLRPLGRVVSSDRNVIEFQLKMTLFLFVNRISTLGKTGDGSTARACSLFIVCLENFAGGQNRDTPVTRENVIAYLTSLISISQNRKTNTKTRRSTKKIDSFEMQLRETSKKLVNESNIKGHLLGEMSGILTDLNDQLVKLLRDTEFQINTQDDIQFHTWLFPTDEEVHWIALRRLQKTAKDNRKSSNIAAAVHENFDTQNFANFCRSGTKRHLDTMKTKIDEVKKFCDLVGLDYHAFVEDAELFDDLLGRYARHQDIEEFSEKILVRNLVYSLTLYFVSDTSGVLTPSRFRSVKRYVNMHSEVVNFCQSLTERHMELDKFALDSKPIRENEIPQGHGAFFVRDFWVSLRSIFDYHLRKNPIQGRYLLNSEDRSLEMMAFEFSHHRGPLQNWVKASNSVNRRFTFHILLGKLEAIVGGTRGRSLLQLPIRLSPEMMRQVIARVCEIPRPLHELYGDIPALEDEEDVKQKKKEISQIDIQRRQRRLRDSLFPLRLAVVSLSAISLRNPHSIFDNSEVRDNGKS